MNDISAEVNKLTDKTLNEGKCKNFTMFQKISKVFRNAVDYTEV